MHLKSFSLVVLATTCGLCFSADSDKIGALQISGFRQGLIEFDSNHRPRIYSQGNEFAHQMNGFCVAANKEIPCQWYGFEFSFTAFEDVSAVECVTTSDRPQNHVHPGAVVAKGTQTVHWGFTLKGRSGHYIRPQYTFDVKDSPLRMAISCTNKGREVLSWKLTLNPPVLAKASQ